MLLGAPREAAGMGPSGVPEEDHAAFGQPIGHPDQVPFPAGAGIEGILDLLSIAHGLVQYEFLGVVSSVALLWNGEPVCLLLMLHNSPNGMLPH
jgi:hypothetical protein